MLTIDEILLSLCNEIVRIRGKEDMLQLIRNTLKEFIRFNDSFILRYNKKTRTARPYIYHAEQQLAQHPAFKNYLVLEYTVTDDSVGDSNHPIVYNIASMLPGGSEQVVFLNAAGIKEFVVVKLIERNQLTGLFVLLSEQLNCFQQAELNLLHRISYLISTATANIIANEEIAQKEEEKSILLSLSNEIAAVKNKYELTKLLNTRLIDLFSISGFGITMLNDDKATHSPFIVDADRALKNDTEYKKVVNLKYSINDGVFNKIIDADAPVTLQVDELAAFPEAPEYVSFWKKLGVKKVVGIPVRVGATSLGCFILLHTIQIDQDFNTNLLTGICAQISVAIANILAMEEIAERENEKSLLLSLSYEIAGIRSRDDLFQVVNSRLKQLFSIQEFGIGKINEDRRSYSAFGLDQHNNLKDIKGFNEVTSSNYSVNDTVFSRVMGSDRPVFFRVSDLLGEQGIPEYVKFWDQAGFNEVLCIALRTGGTEVGCVFLHPEAGTTLIQSANLLSGVCAHLSVAVSNILANEEIAKREKERTLLLSLSFEISAVRSNNALLALINDKLKKWLAFTDSLIATIDKDKKTASSFLFGPDYKTTSASSGRGQKYSRYNIAEGLINRAISIPGPVVINLDKMQQEQGLPAYLKQNYQDGIKQIAIIRFSKADEVFGFWMLFFEQKNALSSRQLNLIEGLSNQLSIAVLNIIANQDIQHREEEKSKLLTFSNAIASVRDRDALNTITNQQFKELFQIQEYIIYALDPDKAGYHPMLLNPKTIYFAGYPDFIRLSQPDASKSEDIFTTTLGSEEPVLFEVAMPPEKLPPKIGTTNQPKARHKKIVGYRIKLGGEKIALLYFEQNDGNQKIKENPLFSNICSQLAFRIANIIANEKIVNQLAQINKYRQQLEQEKIYLTQEIETTKNYSDIIGQSPSIKKVFRLIEQVAPSISTVLLLGETGTGKELIARAIHNLSPRKDKLMIKVNCAAIPPNLIESELFGHEKGSFTGATERRLGKFELANNGTLFLDEIGEMPVDLQVKLLRAIQELEIERVGGSRIIKVDVRIIAATNRNLEKMLEEGKFRSDLYYRLNIFPIQLPPLRDRLEDIPELANYFLSRFSKKLGKQIQKFSTMVLQEFTQYSWPGNIREMEHIVERSVLLTHGNTIDEIHLPTLTNKRFPAPITTAEHFKTLDENEKEYILRVLKKCSGKIAGEAGAAALLGIPPSTLNSKIKKLGIKKVFFS